MLGAIYPLSGPQAEGGRQELAGVQAALRVSGANVRLQVIDATTPQAASAAVDTLVGQYHVPAILGTYGSTLSAAASSRAEELKTVYWETGAVADPITAHRHYVFRTVATGSALGRIAVTFTHDVLLKESPVAAPRAVVVRVNDVYGRSVGGGEEQLAKADGIDVVDVIEYNPSNYDPNFIAARLARDRADYLWDVSYIDDGVAIWKAVLSHNIQLKRAPRSACSSSASWSAPDRSAYTPRTSPTQTSAPLRSRCQARRCSLGRKPPTRARWTFRRWRASSAVGPSSTTCFRRLGAPSQPNRFGQPLRRSTFQWAT